MRSDITRRQVAFDPSTSTLTVGGRTTTVTCAPGDNDCLLRTYLGLVAEQRKVALDGSVVLRRDDIAVLAELLDLDDADLEARLRRILHLSAADAAALHRRLLRHKVAAAAVGVGLLAGVPAGTAVAAAGSGTGDATEPPALETVVQLDPVVPDAIVPIVVVPAAAEPEPAPRPEPAPQPEPAVEIGHTVTYERDPSYVPPEGVDIGDALVIER